MDERQKQQIMRKTNMKLFPLYKKLGWDYLFYYTIDFLFLTQIKGISASNVVLKSTFGSLFKIILQIPANIIVELLGRKNSAILGNFLNCLYMVMIMISRNLFDLILAEFFGALAFSIKNIAEPSLLNESIPPSKYKSQIYAKINAKGASGYYLLGSISKIIAGFLYTINCYLPFLCSLFILIIVTILSTLFIEPVRKKKKQNTKLMYKQQMKDIKEGFQFVFKSERLKALILCSAVVEVLLTILMNYYVSLFENLLLSSFIIGIISAIGSMVSAYASKKQKRINEQLKNKTLMVNAMLLSSTTIIAGICGIKGYYTLCIVLIVFCFLINCFCKGLQYTIIDRYLRNFANEKIDTKIFAAKSLFVHSFCVVGGLFASFLLDKMAITYCMIILGVFFTIIYWLTGKYMKHRVGLNPTEYSQIERKYDEQKG